MKKNINTMKKNLIYCTLIFLCSSVIFPSCTKTLNTVKPTSTITTSVFWQNEDDANGALIGMYTLFREQNQNIYLSGEERGDAWEGGVYGYGTFTLPENSMTPDVPVIGTWAGYYQVVNAANLILKYVPDIEFRSEDEKNRILAQAYTMRAYIYYVMTRTWGDLIIKREPTENADPITLQVERSSQKEIFSFIKDDIDKAISLFPDNNFSSGRNKWSKPAANFLKASVYLWTGKLMGGGNDDFDVALSSIDEVEHSDVELLDNFEDVFKFDNKGNKEIIMSMNFSELEGGNNFYWHMWIIGSAVPANLPQNVADIILPVGSGQGLSVLRRDIMDQFNSDDARKEATFLELFNYDEQHNPTTYYTNVFLKGSGEVVGGNRIFDSDFIIFRYADLLLMKSELLNALGLDPSEGIMKVRKRAYGSNYASHAFSPGSPDFNDEEILKERLLELVGEGKRWWDLIRFNRVFDLVPALQGREDDKYLLLFPIPTTTLSIEPKVEQNPGYSKD